MIFSLVRNNSPSRRSCSSGNGYRHRVPSLRGEVRGAVSRLPSGAHSARCHACCGSEAILTQHLPEWEILQCRRSLRRSSRRVRRRFLHAALARSGIRRRMQLPPRRRRRRRASHVARARAFRRCTCYACGRLRMCAGRSIRELVRRVGIGGLVPAPVCVRGLGVQ